MTPRSRRPAGLLASLALLCAVAPTAVAQQPAPAGAPAAGGPGYLTELVVGLDGMVPYRLPAPVWVTLVNPADAEQELRLTVRSGSAQLEERVTLPAGGRRRLCLGLIVVDEVLVQLRRGREVLEERLVKDVYGFEVERHLLCVDGRPPERRTGALSRREDGTLRTTTILAENAPTEPACYAGFGAVALRELDPDALTADQRAALLEYVREGGTLLVTEVNAQHPAAAAFLAGLAGPEQQLEPGGGSGLRLPGAVTQRSHGLGRVLACPDDPLAAAAGRDGTAPIVKQALGDLVEEGRLRALYPRVLHQTDGQTEGPGGRPGGATMGLVGGFLLLYLLAVGPVLAIAFRKSSRRRLALVTAGLIGGFSLLAPLVAGIVRTASGVVFARTVLYVPPQGPAVELGDVTAVSGGAAGYELKLTGSALAATVLPPGSVEHDYVYKPQREWNYYSRVVEPNAVRTVRGDDVTVELAMSPWGRQSLVTQALVPRAAPLTASLQRAPDGLVATIRNTSGERLERAIVIEQVQESSLYNAPFVALGTLEPGQERQVELPTSAQNPRYDAQWHHALGLHPEWQSWTLVAPPRTTRDAAGLRWVVLSRTRPAVAVSGPNVRVVVDAVRIDPIPATAGLRRGFLGVTLEDQYGVVRVTEVIPGSPAESAGLSQNDQVITIDDVPVRSAAHAVELIGRRLPGDVLTVEYYPSGGVQRTIRTRLADRSQFRGPGE